MISRREFFGAIGATAVVTSALALVGCSQNRLAASDILGTWRAAVPGAGRTVGLSERTTDTVYFTYSFYEGGVGDFKHSVDQSRKSSGSMTWIIEGDIVKLELDGKEKMKNIVLKYDATNKTLTRADNEAIVLSR